ncbi:MAG: DNA-directed RNA polymerase subunit alpha [Dehalococcoidia bacterium]
MLATVIPKTEYQSVSETQGRFIIEPLEPGYGLTVGNAVRRVLLSSLPGAAITTAKIEGVQHEFSTISDMKEDILEFLLNVKGIRFRYHTNRSDTLKLEASGEGEVKAGDIEKSASFEIVNPEHHLATLDKPEAKLNVEFTVEIGKGYTTAGSAEGYPIGVLPTDAVFTPIRRVNYDVEKTRVEDRSDYDRLTLDIWTDGTISPESALSESARILSQQFTLFTNLGQPGEGPAALAEEEAQAAQTQKGIPLEQLGLSSRTINALRRGGISTTDALLSKTRDELLGLKNFGIKSWNEVQEQLIKSGMVEGEVLPEETEGEETTPETSDKDFERGEMLKKLGERFTVRGEK